MKWWSHVPCVEKQRAGRCTSVHCPGIDEFSHLAASFLEEARRALGSRRSTKRDGQTLRNASTGHCASDGRARPARPGTRLPQGHSAERSLLDHRCHGTDQRWRLYSAYRGATPSARRERDSLAPALLGCRARKTADALTELRANASIRYEVRPLLAWCDLSFPSMAHRGTAEFYTYRLRARQCSAGSRLRRQCSSISPIPSCYPPP